MQGGAGHREMSSKGRDQPNPAQSVSWFLSPTTDHHPAGVCNLLRLGLVKLEQALCRAGCTASGQMGPAVPVSVGGFAQSWVSGKGQDNEHLMLRLFLPATSSDSHREMCSWDNNNQAYQGTDSSQHSQGSCQRNYSPPGQTRFHSINDP